MNFTVTYAGMTDKGRIRQRNEDNWVAVPEQGLFDAADGMGGHAAGDIASRIVVERLPVLLAKTLPNIVDLSSTQAVEELNAVISHLNEEVRHMSKSRPGLSGMGATVVILLIRAGTALVAHMGDSRIYLLRGGQLRQLTMDHSVVQVLINSGEISQEEAANHPARGKITRCVGMAGEVVAETMTIAIESGDRFLLCSDGLTGMLSDPTITDTLMENTDKDNICQKLVRSANEAGGVDNVTVLLIDCFKDDSPHSDVAVVSDTEELSTTLSDAEKPVQPVAFVINLDKQPTDFSLPIIYPSFTIGRANHNSLAMSRDRTVSRSHCIISVRGAELTIEDLESRNGTYLNGKRIKGVIPLPVPSWISLGRSKIGIIPPDSSFQQEDLLDEAYTTEGSILIPPSEFFEERVEALLVVDIVGSTKIVKHGETQLVKVVSALGQMLDRSLQKEKQPFLKCTGDGFFATFQTATDALKAAEKLSPGLLRHIKFNVQICIALHWGSVRLTQDGERTGRNAHAVFSLEDLRHRETKVSDFLTVHGKPVIILMTESFHKALDAEIQKKAVNVGNYNLKGLDKEETIYKW